MMESPLSVYALRVLAVGLFIVAVLGVLRGYFRDLALWFQSAISQIIEQIINAIVSIAGAKVHVCMLGAQQVKNQEKNYLVRHMELPVELLEQ